MTLCSAITPILLRRRGHRSLQESQQEAFANVGGRHSDGPTAMTNHWYPDLGQNMSGT